MNKEKLTKIYLNNICLNQRTINTNIIFVNCILSVISSNVQGGTISVEGNYLMSINDTTFYQCMNVGGNNNGGAIWFVGLDSELIRVCALLCQSWGNHFCYIISTSDKKNFLKSVSVTQCYNKTINYQTVTLANGIQNLTDSNFSLNKNIQITGVYYIYSYDMNTNYCTFFNNTSGGIVCIWFGLIGKLFKNNIIENNSPNGYGVLYVPSGTPIINECLFYKNKDTLIKVDSGSLTLTKCLLDKSYPTIGNVITNEIKIELSNTFQLNHYNTKFIYNNNLIICFGEKNFLIKTNLNQKKYYKFYFLIYILN